MLRLSGLNPRTGILDLIGGYFSSESIWISLKNIGNGLSPLHLVFAIIFAIRAVAIWSAILTSRKAFTVEFETLGILTGATLPLPCLAQGRLVFGPLGATMVV